MRRLWCGCLCLALASCAETKRYGDHPPVPVSGQVLVNGQPAKGVVLTFYHDGDWGKYSIVPQGWTDDSGRFEMATYGVKDGAPEGDYLVTAEWPAYIRAKEWGPDKLGGKYAKKESSGLKVHVEKAKNELLPFELKADVNTIKVGEAAARDRRNPKRRSDDR
jgi:hypothetical protein